MEMLQVTINGLTVEVAPGTTILEAAKKVQVKIPTLCHHPDLEPWAACGICVVKAEGSPKMFRACATPVTPGMRITTHDPEIYQVRKTVIELILSTHPDDCLQCPRNGNCELQRLAEEFGIRENPYEKRLRNLKPDESTGSIILNPEKCILCGRCREVCQNMQNVWALEFIGRGENTRIAPAADVLLGNSPCIKCGQCSAHCPVGAIYEKSDAQPVYKALENPDLHTVVQIAPAVRVAIGEAFGYEPGTLLTGKLYAALRRLGFNAVFDTNFAADLTIMEEGSEFVERFTKQTGPLPLITSCCPSWTDYMEKFAPDFIDNFSSAKSPHEMLGTMVKTYYAQNRGIDPAKIFSVSIMPCTAKKYEITRTSEMFASGYQDVDIVLTTRELSRMIKSAGIDFCNLPDEECDSILGDYSGAGTIFGVTGGVMEAALRTAHFLITGENLPGINFMPARGLEGIKEATVEIAGNKIRIAVAHQMANIEEVLKRVRQARDKGGEPYYHFIEVMACRGGCVGGGGQPYGATDEIRKKRAAGIYSDDEHSTKRFSHENPEIQRIYKDFLEKPLSHKAHKYLHTKYQKLEKYRFVDSVVEE
ncbi:MAG: NADH-dependent [FeFe] hydrogenase, group A6 [Kiritimatiellae bacterium]|nr:NADH-dependent [FeFe] hydrogenase, group A6 [Kiritimatiellia bacterium]